jgi:hypothetical protein
MKPIARYMEETGISVGQLATAAGLDTKLIKAIVSGNYTPSPSQRQRLAVGPGRFDGRHFLGTRGLGPTHARVTVHNADAQLN